MGLIKILFTPFRILTAPFKKKEAVINEKKGKKEKKEYVDKELKREIKHLKHAIHRAPQRVDQLEILLAKYQVKFNQAIAAGAIKNKDTVNAEIQKVQNVIADIRKERKEKITEFKREKKQEERMKKAA